jgi:hypothetical protein
MIYESRLGISVHIKFLMEFDVIYVDWFVDDFMAFLNGDTPLFLEKLRGLLSLACIKLILL